MRLEDIREGLFIDSKAYRSMSRSIYNMLRREGFEIRTGAIRDISLTLAKEDARIIQNNERRLISGEDEKNMLPTSLSMYFGLQNGEVSKQEYLSFIADEYRNAEPISFPEDFDTRMKGFTDKYGNFNFNFELTGETHKIKTWNKLYKEGKITRNMYNDIIESFKHSRAFDKAHYNSNR